MQGVGGLLGWVWESHGVTALGRGRFVCRHSPQSCQLQFGIQCLDVDVVLADLLDRKHLRHAPKFFVRRVVVRSHHNLRRLITKETALEVRWF